MKRYNIGDLLAKATASNIPKVDASAGGSSKYSFGIVNSKSNGKRLSFSKALAAKLQLTDAVHIIPVPEDGVVMLAKEFPPNTASVGNLSGDDKKLCYSAQLVKLLAAAFQLDFSTCVSRSFPDISFEAHDGVTIAVVNMTTDKTASQGAEEAQEETA